MHSAGLRQAERTVDTAMHPVLFQLGPLTIYAYGALVALACAVGTLWAAKRAESAGLNPDKILQAIFWMIIVGFAGARLLYVIYYPEIYLRNPLQILLDRGGLVWYGGLVAATATGLIFAWRQQIPVRRFMDILILPAALGLAIGRIGCFFSGCCYGKISQVAWAVHFPPGHETHPHSVHPTQLYESFSLVLATLALQQVYRRKANVSPGMTTGLFFVVYGIIRFIIEYFRGDGVYWVPGLLTASQTISLVGMLFGAGLIVASSLKPAPWPGTSSSALERAS